ncbi:kinase-like domain-containing protein [Haematococcus lacustris]
MPGVMRHGVIDLNKVQGAVADALMQACSYCQEKGWRFSFITSYNFVFFIWRVAENKYAVTNGILHDAKVFDLFIREILAYIIWMSLEAPWGNRLPAGKLKELEVELKRRAAEAVLHGRPKELQGQGTTGKRSACTPSRTSGRKQRQRTAVASVFAVRQKDQQAFWVPVQDAPEYPLASLQLSSIHLGAGQCGSVVQGRLWGEPVAVKVTDACKSPDIMELLWHEAQIYEFLRELQGYLLPVLHGSGYWRGRNSFFLATSVVAGKPVSNCLNVAAAQAVAQGAHQALQAIHQRGVAHGDVRADNIMVQHCGSNLQVVIIDFGHAYLDPTPEQCERELAELAQVFHELEQPC